MKRLLLPLLPVLFGVGLGFAETQPAPSETDLAGLTYFAPVCPFFYRMMGPDGELREFQFLSDGTFKSPRGWSASAEDGTIVVRDAKRRRFVFTNGRLTNYQSGKRSYNISYPIEPCYAGPPASLWGLDDSQIDDGQIQRRVDKLTDIWSMTGRFSMWFRSPNAAAGALAGVALLGAALFLACGSFGMGLGLVILLTSLGGLVLTSSRGGILAFLVGFSVLAAATLLNRTRRPVGRRMAILAVCLALAAVFAVATQGSRRFTKSLERTIKGRGEGRDRSELFCAGARMMADAPDGWGIRDAGPAYSHWYQSMGGDTWQVTLVSDQLTRLVGFGWFGRWLWLFGWFAAMAILWKFALRGFSAAGVAIWVSLFVASSFNIMLAQDELWVLPVATLAYFAYRFVRGEARAWRGYLKWLGIALAASLVAVGGLYAVCSSMSPTTPRIRHTDAGVAVGSGAPAVWIVDDGETLGGIYTQNLIRRHYLDFPSAPACVYGRNLLKVPSGVERLVLAGGQCHNYLELFKVGKAPSARQVVFISPPFGPRSVPAALLERGQVAMLLGEFAARYVDVYGEGRHPKWVTLVKGAELYVPDWTRYVIGDGAQ